MISAYRREQETPIYNVYAMMRYRSKGAFHFLHSHPSVDARDSLFLPSLL